MTYSDDLLGLIDVIRASVTGEVVNAGEHPDHVCQRVIGAVLAKFRQYVTRDTQKITSEMLEMPRTCDPGLTQPRSEPL